MKIKGVLSIVLILGLVWIVSFYASGFITGKFISRNPADSVASDADEIIFCKCKCSASYTWTYNLELPSNKDCDEKYFGNPCETYPNRAYDDCRGQTREETEQQEDKKENFLVRFF